MEVEGVNLRIFFYLKLLKRNYIKLLAFVGGGGGVRGKEKQESISKTLHHPKTTIIKGEKFGIQVIRHN